MTLNLDISTILNALPDGLRKPLFDSFQEITVNFREKRWEPSELNGGKLCETVYTILKGYTEGKFPNKPSKPRSMYDACKGLENALTTQFCRSVRIQIPRMLIALYEIRNNRGVGHTGGDVDPNHMDAVAVLYMSKWIMAELVRLFHNITTEKATAIVDNLVERIIPVIWEVDGKFRVLNTNMSMKGKTLVILYQSQDKVAVSDLVSWVEHSNPSVYKKLLLQLHKDRLVEFERKNSHVTISPLGIDEVEKGNLLDSPT